MTKEAPENKPEPKFLKAQEREDESSVASSTVSLAGAVSNPSLDSPASSSVGEAAATGVVRNTVCVLVASDVGASVAMPAAPPLLCFAPAGGFWGDIKGY